MSLKCCSELVFFWVHFHTSCFNATDGKCGVYVCLNTANAKKYFQTIFPYYCDLCFHPVAQETEGGGGSQPLAEPSWGGNLLTKINF